MSDGIVYAMCCQMCPAAAHFQNFMLAHRPLTSQHTWPHGEFSPFSISPKTKTANFRPPTKHMYRPLHCQKCSPDVMQCNCRARTQEMREFIHAAGPSFTSFYDPNTLIARERHSHRVGAALMRKRQTSCWRSVEIGAPVFITLVYRLNSHLPPLSSVLNVPLICSSCACTWNNSLKMNEKETQILSAARWK